MVTQRRNIALENFIFMVATVNHWIIHRRDTGMSNQRNRKIHARKVNWGGSTSRSGVKPDTRKAILWYKEAAEQGYAHAQYTLGLIYRNGSGINVNHYESQKWLKLAAKQHYKNAERLLARLPAH